MGSLLSPSNTKTNIKSRQCTDSALYLGQPLKGPPPLKLCDYSGIWGFVFGLVLDFQDRVSLAPLKVDRVLPNASDTSLLVGVF